MPKQTASITAENTFTDPLGFDHAIRECDFTLSGIFTAIVTVQRSYQDDPDTWFDVEQFNTPRERIIDVRQTGMRYRAGVKTSDFTSGTVELRLSYQ